MTKEFVIKNEFANVGVSLDQTRHGQRLKIYDIRTGKIFYLDALELESLAWCNHFDLNDILNPSLTRWKDNYLESEEQSE